MDRAERLADFLAGDLSPDEQAALEAELARDAVLRADLRAMRDADEALTAVRSPTPPPGFEERLETALAGEVAKALGADGRAVPGELATSGGDRDQLAEQRARRDQRQGPPRWVTAVAGTAAAIVILAGGGVVLSSVLGGADDSGEATFDAQSLESTEEDAMSDDATAESGVVADGPLLLAGDRSVAEPDIQALFDDPAAFGIADRSLDEAAARDLIRPYADALGASDVGVGVADAEVAEESDDGEAMDQDSPDEPATEERAPSASGPTVELRRGPDISEADRAQVGTCLAALLGDEPQVIPTYAELIELEGEPAILYGLVSTDPESGRFTRREAWVVDRKTCEVRLFVQR